MAAINFYLDKKTSTEPTYIMLSLIEHGKRIRISTGEKILPKFWNGQKQKAKRTYQGSIQLNDFLRKFEDDVLGIFREGKTMETQPNAKYIKQKLKELYYDDEVLPKSFFEILDQFIEHCISVRSKNTIGNYRTLKFHLNQFQERTKYLLSFESINMSFKDKFHKFLLQEQNLSDSSVCKNFAVLKRFMRYATEYGYNQSTEFNQFKFKEAPSTKIALTEEELIALEGLDLSTNPRLEKVRDIFLFGCETSLRHSDISTIKPTNIKSTEIDEEEVIYLELIAHKTRGEIQAPLSPKAIQLLGKYKDENRTTCFPKISNQKFNAYIKEIGQLAGIDTPVEVIKFAGNERNEEQVPKYALIGSHTARRTFVTLFFERGGDIASCMVFTGHKSYKELETYRKKTLQHKLRIARNPFQPRIRKVS